MASKLASIFSQMSGKTLAKRHLVRESWDLIHRWPYGKKIYSTLLGLYVPYTGSMKSVVEELSLGSAKVSLCERRSVRNHLRSIHAIAIANLVELTGNLALSYSMPADARFIVSRMEIDYLKKSRGRIVATCNCPIPKDNSRQTYLVPVEVFNEAGELLARASLHSLVGPKTFA